MIELFIFVTGMFNFIKFLTFFMLINIRTDNTVTDANL